MQARLFSYLDTQLTRLGGPNFTQLPINRPHAPVNDNLRDGMHQTRRAPRHRAVPAEQPGRRRGPGAGRASRRRLRADRRGWSQGEKVRANPVSFDDHFSQADDVLRQHERGREAAHRRGVHLRAGQGATSSRSASAMLGVLANVDADLCAQVAAGLGLPAPAGKPADRRAAVAGAVADHRRARARSPAGSSASSPARRPTWPASASCGTRSRPRAPSSGSSPRSAACSARARAGDHRAHAADHPLGRVRRGPRSPAAPAAWPTSS